LSNQIQLGSHIDQKVLISQLFLFFLLELDLLALLSLGFLDGLLDLDLLL